MRPFKYYVYCIIIVISLIFSASIACSKDKELVQTPPNQPAPFTPKNVLFIGNSHTYYNMGIDSELTGFLNEADLSYTTDIRKIAISGFTLEDHWNNTATQNMLQLLDWDLIILQENSTRAANDLAAMAEYAQKFNTAAKNMEAKVYLFMTWAYENEPQMTLQLENNYNQLANQLNATMVPVGLGFKNFISQNPSLQLYDADGIHPSPAGSYLSAGLFYKIIYSKDPKANAYVGSLTLEQADLIKQFLSDFKE